MRKINYLIIFMMIFLTFSNAKALTDAEIEATLTNLTGEVSKVKSDLFLINHPVGSVYTTTSASENTAAKMSSLYGGTWVAYGTGRSVVGIDTANGLFNTIDKTGGSSSVGLVASQIPSLTVTGTTNSTGGGYSIGYGASTRTTSTNGNHTHYLRSLNINVKMDYSVVFEAGTNRGGLNYEESYDNIYADTAGNHNHTYPDYYVNSISGVQSHNHSFTGYYTNNSKANVSIQDPYIVAYMWKRTA